MPHSIDRNGKQEIVLPAGGSHRLSIEQDIELITNLVDRDFSGAGNWIGTGWLVNTGKLRHVTVGDVAIAELTAANMTALSITRNHRYKITVTVSTYIAGSVTPALGNSVGKAITANGTYTQIITCPYDDASLIFVPTAFNGYIDDISISEIVDVLACDSTSGLVSTARVTGKGSVAGYMGRVTGILPQTPPHGTLAFDALDSNALKVFDREKKGWYPSTKFGGNTSLTKGLLCCFNMEENAANTTMVDATGRVTTAVASTNTSNLHATGAGVSAGLADYFDFRGGANNDGVTISGIEPTPGYFLDHGKPWSVSLWMNPDTVAAGYMDIIGNQSIGVANTGSMIIFRQGAYLGFYIQNTTQNRLTLGSTVLSAGTWYHVVFTYSGLPDPKGQSGNFKYYINSARETLGGAVGTAITTSCAQIDTNWYIGCLRGNITYDYDGKMDQVCVWNRELSAAEVALLYGGGAGLAY